MADISSFLKKILSAIYGEEVRGSIHDALAAMNTESSSAMEFASTAKDSAQANAAAAKKSAEDADKKATSASEAAAAAALSEGSIKTSEENVNKQAADAKEAAAGAKASETEAKNSEEIAKQKAQEATDAKTAATLAEGEVKAAEERVRTIRSEAETLGAQATADRNAAEEARAAAEAARDAAANSQNGAKASEDAAAVSKTDAEAAKTAAVAARDKAQTAKTAAENARESAENSEANAKTYKESAAESAATAQQYSGKPPKPENGTWWIWDAEKGTYVNTNISCELTGPTGNGIQSIQLTQGNHMPGSTDIYTVTMTDGSKYNAFALAPYARYSYYENKVVRLFVDGGFGFSTQKVKGADSVNGFEIGFKPGIAIKLNSKFSAVAKCGFLGYRDDYMTGDNGYGFAFTSEDLSFGFHYEF